MSWSPKNATMVWKLRFRFTKLGDGSLGLTYFLQQNYILVGKPSANALGLGLLETCRQSKCGERKIQQEPNKRRYEEFTAHDID